MAMMTRRERQVTDPEKILEILQRSKVVHLGLCDGNQPYVVPMNYGYEMEEGRLTLYLHGPAAAGILYHGVRPAALHGEGGLHVWVELFLPDGGGHRQLCGGPGGEVPGIVPDYEGTDGGRFLF